MIIADAEGPVEKQANSFAPVTLAEIGRVEDADAEFFRRERELRDRMERKALEGTLPSSGTRKVTKKNRSEKRQEVSELESGKGSVDAEIEIVAIEERSPSVAMEEVHDDQNHRNRGMNNERGIRRCIARMHLRHPCRHV